MSAIELYPGVITDSGILGGKPVIKGTRVPVSLVLGQLAGGMSVEEVMYEYYLDLAGIRAALGYAAQRLDEEMIVVRIPDNVPVPERIQEIINTLDALPDEDFTDTLIIVEKGRFRLRH